MGFAGGVKVEKMQTKCSIGPYTFNSEFECGNAGHFARRRGENGADDVYDVYVAPDCSDKGSGNSPGYRTWFCFSVSGGTKGKTIRFTIRNLGNLTRLYNQGMLPVVCSRPSRPSWERIEGNCETSFVNASFQLRFSHTFPADGDTTFFAFTFPFTYTDCQNFLGYLTKRFSMQDGLARRDHNVYFHRELMTRSLEGRRVDLLTISSYDHILPTQEGPLQGLFPEGGERPFSFSKKQYIFVAARVHPGEVPASYVFNGFLSFILHPDDARAVELRRRYVFKLVPMLNPDGVYRGHQRADTLGMNLNRCYLNPDPLTQPTIYATKMVIMQLHHMFPAALKVYLDMHGTYHKGNFIHGNSIEPVSAQIDNILYAKVVAAESPYFDFGASNFSEKNMASKDKRDGLSKAGSGRVAIYQATKIPYCYTVEASYNATWAAGTTHTSGNGPNPKNVYADVGKALAVAILDIDHANPKSSIPSLMALRDEIAANLPAMKKSNRTRAPSRSSTNNLAVRKFSRKERAPCPLPTELQLAKVDIMSRINQQIHDIQQRSMAYRPPNQQLSGQTSLPGIESRKDRKASMSTSTKARTAPSPTSDHVMTFEARSTVTMSQKVFVPTTDEWAPPASPGLVSPTKGRHRAPSAGLVRSNSPPQRLHRNGRLKSVARESRSTLTVSDNFVVRNYQMNSNAVEVSV